MYHLTLVLNEGIRGDGDGAQTIVATRTFWSFDTAIDAGNKLVTELNLLGLGFDGWGMAAYRESRYLDEDGVSVGRWLSLGVATCDDWTYFCPSTLRGGEECPDRVNHDYCSHVPVVRITTQLEGVPQ